MRPRNLPTIRRRWKLLALMFALGTILVWRRAPEDVAWLAAPPPKPDAATRAKLERIVREAQFANTPLRDVLAWLSKQGDIAVVPDWNDLNRLGITADTPCTARLRNVKWTKCLRTILADLKPVNSSFDPAVVYEVEGDQVLVISNGKAHRRVVAMLYDLQDLLTDSPQHVGRPDFDLETQYQWNGDQVTERMMGITDLVMETIDPSYGWHQKNPQAVGQFKWMESGWVLVINTPDNHRSLQGLLDQVREARQRTARSLEDWIGTKQ